MTRKRAPLFLLPIFVFGVFLLLRHSSSEQAKNHPAAPPSPSPALATAFLDGARPTLSAGRSVVHYTNVQPYPSLDEALTAARQAMQPLDPSSRHSRGADYFCSSHSQQLRAWFSKDGIELASGLPTEGNGEPWNLQLQAASIGRSSTNRSLQATNTTARGSRVELSDTSSGVMQWFENRREGIEQGFVVEQRPPGDEREFHLTMNAFGTLTAGNSDRSSPDSITFYNEDGGAEVTYSGLVSWDAEGNVLPSRIEARGSQVTLVIQDRGAIYPVTVDPLFATADARLLPASKDDSYFGISVALSADTAVIGAPEEDTPAGSETGSAYVFKRTAGVWHGPIKLTPSDESASNFGSKVAISGDSAIVAAYDCAFVFVRSGTVWQEEAKLTATGPDQYADFGASVAISGNTAVVGAMDAGESGFQSRDMEHQGHCRPVLHGVRAIVD